VTPEALAAELAAGRLRPAYLIAGAEPWLRDRALAAVREAVLGAGPADFDLDRIEGDSASPGALWDAVRTLPVLAARRLVWLREPTGARAAGGASGRWRALSEALPEVLADLAPEGRVVLVVSAGPPDRRLTWVRAFGDAIVECEAPRDPRALAAFVRDEAGRRGIRIGAAAAQRLAERVGPQLLRLSGELDKAALLAGPGAEVTLNHVLSSVADLAEEPIFELTDAIGEGRAGDALAVLGKLRAGGAPPPVVLAALAGHVRKLLRVRAGATVAAPPFVRRKLEAQERRYGPARLLACLRAIHETDEALKGQGALAPELALERLVIALAS
jgi:DNA polymerase-3 subunit delta